ncbi:MAG: hypothetical protein PVF26_10280 [Desulfobacterales bacterium]
MTSSTICCVAIALTPDTCHLPVSAYNMHPFRSIKIAIAAAMLLLTMYGCAGVKA